MLTKTNQTLKNRDCQLKREKTCSEIKLTGITSEYEYFQLRDFVGMDGFHLPLQSFYAFSQ